MMTSGERELGFFLDVCFTDRTQWIIFLEEDMKLRVGRDVSGSGVIKGEGEYGQNTIICVYEILKELIKHILEV